MYTHICNNTMNLYSNTELKYVVCYFHPLEDLAYVGSGSVIQHNFFKLGLKFTLSEWRYLPTGRVTSRTVMYILIALTCARIQPVCK